MLDTAQVKLLKSFQGFEEGGESGVDTEKDQDWRDGSEDKNTGCSFRLLRFSS